MGAQKASITDAVDQLRSELSNAVLKKPETGIQFDIDNIEVELQLVFEVSGNIEVSGGWSVLGWSLGAKSEAGASRTGVHTVKLSLSPKVVDASGERSDMSINAESPKQS